jgi:uncharacterized membrane protein YfcA
VSLVEASFLLITGILAGVVGSGGGITSLVSYPALLAVGIPPLPANVVNLVAAAAIGPGSAVTSRRELTDAGPVLLRLLPIAAVGSVVGSVLLLTTPAGMFARMVPFLVAGGSLVLLAQPALMKLRDRILVSAPLLTGLLVGAVSVYSGYFGAGSGVMLLAVTSVLVEPRIAPANAIKNMLIGASSVVAAVVFMINGDVQWNAVLPLAGGLLIGSAFGPVAVRHLPPNLVRWLAAACGFLFAAYLWLRPA